MRHFSYHLKHYLPLLGILSAGIVGFAVFSYDKTFQMIIIIAVAMGYITWGIIHHYIHRDLYPEVVFEYVIMAFLGVVLIFSVIFRS